MSTRVLVVEPKLTHSAWIKPVFKSVGIDDYEIQPDPFFALDAYLSGKYEIVLAAWPNKVEGCEWIFAAKSMLRDANPPIIAMASESHPRWYHAVVKHKADDIICKPFGAKSLSQLLWKYIRRDDGENVIRLADYLPTRRQASAGAR